jgi:hypothetical protein
VNQLEANHAEALLRSASVLLVRGAHLEAVHALHEQARLAIGYSQSLPDQYKSATEAEAQHRQLLAALIRDRSQLHESWWTPRALLVRIPRVIAWSMVGLVVVALVLRYAFSFGRVQWQQRHPEGHWISRYYANAHFAGFPVVRYDVGVSYDFGEGAPADDMARDRFSVLWDTCVAASEDVTFNLRLASDDASRLLLDGAPQIEIGPQPGRQTARMHVSAGIHHVRIEFVEDQGVAMIRLRGLRKEGKGYRLQRPVLDGDQVRCEAGPPGVSGDAALDHNARRAPVAERDGGRQQEDLEGDPALE